MLSRGLACRGFSPECAPVKRSQMSNDTVAVVLPLADCNEHSNNMCQLMCAVCVCMSMSFAATHCRYMSGDATCLLSMRKSRYLLHYQSKSS